MLCCDVSVMSQWRFGGVSVMSRCCFGWCLCDVSVLSLPFFADVSVLFWWGFVRFLVVFWGCFSDVLVTSRACFGEISVMCVDGAVMFMMMSGWWLGVVSLMLQCCFFSLVMVFWLFGDEHWWTFWSGFQAKSQIPIWICILCTFGQISVAVTRMSTEKASKLKNSCSRSCLGLVSVMCRSWFCVACKVMSLGVTVVSRVCFRNALLMSRGSRDDVLVTSRCCFGGVMVMSRSRFRNALLMFRWCFNDVSVVSQWYHRDVTVMLWWCFGLVLVLSRWCLRDVLAMSRWCLGVFSV